MLIRVLFLLILGTQAAFAWTPYAAWRDSYAVDGICYCDSSNFDHGIGDVKVQTPDGYRRSVRQICADINHRFGQGAATGRTPYNTIACGNAPANDAPDEDLVTGCPGRVDIGEAGCFEIGPQWPLKRLYGQRMRPLDRTLWKISVSHNSSASSQMADGNGATRWTSDTKQSAGQWIEIDLGGQFLVNVVDLDSIASRNDSPVDWLVETSSDGRSWSVVSDSQGRTGDVQTAEVTRIKFPPAAFRHLRVTQTGSSPSYYWSVHELHIGFLPDE